MGKRLDIGEHSFRKRRGEWVQIPDEWVGNTTHGQTIRKRPSKMTRKARNQEFKQNNREIGFGKDKYLKYKRGEDVFDELDEYEQEE